MIVDLIYILLIAGLYDVLVYNYAEHIYEDLEYDEKMENILFLIFIIGLVTIVALFLYFPKSSYYNSSVSRGLFLGSVGLIAYTTFGNWQNISSTIKLLIIAISLAVVMWLSYRK